MMKRWKVVASGVGVMVVGVASWWGWRAAHPAPFPNALPHTGFRTDVSFEKASIDHGISVQDSMGAMHYYAAKAVDGYPFQFYYTTRCSASAPALGMELEGDPKPDADVGYFAQGNGWNASTGGRWYIGLGKLGRLQVLVTPEGSNCQVFVVS